MSLLRYVLNSVFYREETILLVTIVAAAVLLVCSGHINKKASSSIPKERSRSFEITCTDLIIYAYLLYGLANMLFVNNRHIDSIVPFKWIALFLGYVFLRRLSNKNIVLYVLFIAGVIQGLTAIGQKADVLESNHRMFDITGSFGNPGQLGGFLAVTVAVSLGLLTGVFRQRKKTLIAGVLSGTIIQFAAFWLADSRAGMVGLAVGIAVVFGRYPNQIFRKYRAASITVCLAAIVGMGMGLYSYRPASADARLLIWRVGTSMVADKPIAGHGIGSFNEKYMLYQAGYFKENPASRFIMVADDAAYPYNELLHVLIEQGIIGLLIALTLFISVFAYKSKDDTQLTLKGGLAALVAYSMFSYPSYVFPVLFLFPVLLGALDSKGIYRCKLPEWGLITVAVILTGTIVSGIVELRFYRNASNNLRQLFVRNTGNRKAIEYVNDNFDKLKYNPRFSNMYSEWLAKVDITPDAFDKADNLLPTYETYCDIGSIYFKAGNYQKAEKYYTTASYMIPTRLTPNYYLWKIYRETGNQDKTTQTANKILTQPLKVENTFTLRIKAEVVGANPWVRSN